MRRRAGFPSALDAWRTMVARHAERPAIECGSDVLTYTDLDRATSRFAQWLIARGGDAPVAMVAPFDPASIVAMLGTLKAGRVFVPLDPRETPDRIRTACERVGAELLAPDAVTASAGAHDEDPGFVFDVEAPSIIYFSSGSTGAPSAGLKTHGNLTLALVYGYEPHDRCGLMLPIAFGATISAIFGPLCSGGTVCMFDPIAHGVPAMADWIDRAGLTLVDTAPSVLRAIAAALEREGRTVPRVRRIRTGGEPVRHADLEAMRRAFPAATIINHYGATEASFIACTVIAPDDPLDPDPLAFRTVFPDQRVAIVDAQGECPVGTAGEIVVTGTNVSLRYWSGRDDEGRWTETGGVRTFRTGDRGRFLEDGSLEHLGRIDHRVKVHGQSVDIVAIERALAAIDGVAEAAVAAAPDGQGRTRLVAYVVPSALPGPPTRDLRAALADTVPAFMIPSSFVRLRALPRSDRGKLDRMLLAAGAGSTAERPASGGDPRTPVEAELAAIVADVFGVPQVGIDDDLFDLGLDSLSLHDVIGRAHARWAVTLSSRDFVEAPTVAALAPRLEAAGTGARGSVFPAHRGGEGVPFYFVPWIAGAKALSVRRMAVRLGRPAFVLASANDDDSGRVNRSVPETAARLVETLSAAAPDGPLILGGHSFGAMMALEMANQLAAAGRRPALLVLIEPASGDKKNTAERLRMLISGPPGAARGPAAVAKRLAEAVRMQVEGRWAAATANVLSRAPAEARRVNLHVDMVNKRRYRPQPYDGPALLVRTPEWPIYDRLDLTKFLSGDCRVIAASGDHSSVMLEPHVTALARSIRGAIDDVDRHRRMGHNHS